MEIKDLENKKFRNSDKYLLSMKDLEDLGIGEESFKILLFENQEKVKEHIKECEGKHVQQIAYSSHHDALTQICFGCKKIRTSMKEEDIQ